jgi:hypothetical protein
VRSFPWEGNHLGAEHIVVPPFEPVRVVHDTVDVWGRRYRFGPTGLPTSMTALGSELLAAPIRLEGVVTGQSAQLQAIDSPAAPAADDTHALLAARGQLGTIDVALRADTEFDGAVTFELTLTPADATPLDRLDLVIPLQGLTGWEAIRNGRDAAYGTVPATDGAFWSASSLPPCANLLGTFLPYACLTDGERALAWCADSDEGWLLDDHQSSFFLERAGDQVLMRARLCNTPSLLKAPRTIRFMLQALPAKPLPPDYRWRMWDTPNAHFGYMAGFQGSCFWSYGVGPTISLYQPEDYAILKGLLDADRGRCARAAAAAPGPKFPGVTSWYNTTNCLGLAMPEYDCYGGEWLGATEPQPTIEAGYVNYKSPWGVWSTPRQQSRAYADLAPSTVDCRVWCYAQQLAKSGLQGYWWDHLRFWSSGSLLKGTAYRRDDGQIQGRFNIGAMREMMRRMAVVAAQQGQPPFHGYYAHGNVGPIGSYLQYLWAIEGPWYMTSAKTDLLDNFRGGLDGLKVLANRYAGVPVTLRGETYDRNSPDKHQTRCCLGVGLLFDVGVGFEGGAVDGRTRDALLRALAAWGWFEAGNQWIPYWRSAAVVQPGDPGLLATVYRRPAGGSLIVLFNASDRDLTAVLAVDGLAPGGTGLTDLETGAHAPPLLTVKRHDFRLLTVPAAESRYTAKTHEGPGLLRGLR